MKKFKIVDWYVHQGNQYEFSKIGHDIFLIGANGQKPDWNTNHRPLPKNITLITEEEARAMTFDVVMLRSPISLNRSKYFLSKGAAGIANIQTNIAYTLPLDVRHVVWNSKDIMKKSLGFYKNRKNHYIVHGFDPNEFKPIPEINENLRVLTVANSFKKRDEIMGYDIWTIIKKYCKECDVVGSGNEDIPGALPHTESFKDLIRIYNEYSIFLNTTRFSANPRSRAEAALCGMPIISTSNYEFKEYFRNGKDAILSNDTKELIDAIQKLLKSKNMREDFGSRARERAIEHFHIRDYITKWNSVLNKL